ncbi:MAG: hypothetical protein EBR28_04790 [Planctomycetia bacterium]|nr:hypothetical protein [Planctomycetia bacterium]
MTRRVPILLRAAGRWAGATILAAVVAAPARSTEPVEAAPKPGRPFVARPTRTLADLPVLPIDASLDRFGGLAPATEQATGFFRVEKIGDRWWLVDPDGGRFISRGMNSVATVPTKGGRTALEKKFFDIGGWATTTSRLLRESGFNTTGAWSDHESLARVEPPLATCRLWSFMSSYGKKRGGTFMQAGHVGYPNDCPFIFDPEFPAFCREHARQLAAGKDDPWLLGHFSDNEMPWSLKLLENYLGLPESDPGHRAAKAWLAARRNGESGGAITDSDRGAFLEHAMDTYLGTVAAAIREHDPNHLFLGVRLHEPVFDLPEVYRAAGRHCDIVSVNYYRAWTPDREQMAMWAGQAKKPFMVTEHYAKGADSGMGNTGGAGWLVKTQQNRGRFYQNFALGLLESRHCVGWHWHRYADNDPDDKKVDPSNRDSNKGIVTARYEPWQPLLDEMRPFNERVYGIISWLDTRPSSDAPEALR